MTFEELLQQFGVEQHHGSADDGRGRTGATPEQIETASTLRTLDTKESIRELQEHRTTCNVCLEDFKCGDEVRKLNACPHAYHKECIDRWLSRVPSCPICKAELNNN